MNEHYYYDKIPKNFPCLFFNHIPTEKIDEKWVGLSSVIYSENHQVKRGEFLLWGGGGNENLYNIAIGNIIEKEGKKYYQVYPELFDWKQAKLITNVFKIVTLPHKPYSPPSD